MKVKESCIKFDFCRREKYNKGMESKTVEVIKEYLAERPEIKIGYLFGSQATGTFNKLSDIDIAIFIDKMMVDNNQYPYGYKAKVTTDLMKILKSNKVDLVILNDAPYLLRHRVIRYGKIIYSFQESERVKFQVDTINRYLDFKSLLNIHYGV